MTQNQIPNPYSSNPVAPSATPGVTSGPVTSASPAALGVKPDARLAQAFLTQAFVWMFAGLLVTAGVAYVVQTTPTSEMTQVTVLLCRKMFRTSATSRPISPMNRIPPSFASERLVTWP